MMNIKRTAEDAAAGEDPDELYLAENVFWVPKEARRSHLQANAKQPSIGKLIDEAMAAIEVANPGLKGVHGSPSAPSAPASSEKARPKANGCNTAVRSCWHRTGFRRYWRWKSRSLGGRPQVDADLRQFLGAESHALDDPGLGHPTSNTAVAGRCRPADQSPPAGLQLGKYCLGYLITFLHKLNAG